MAPTTRSCAHSKYTTPLPAEGTATAPTLQDVRRGCRLLQRAAKAKLLEAYVPLGKLIAQAEASPDAPDAAALAYQRGARDARLDSAVCPNAAWVPCRRASA